MRTEFSQTRLQADGTYETTLSSVPLNYRDASGTWRRIDSDLVRARDGWLSNGANSVDVQIPRVANDPVRFVAGGRALSFSLANADAGVIAEDAGHVARFENAVKGVDASYEVIGKALKETLTLASADVPSVYRFDVESAGLTPQASASGTVRFVDGDGRQQLGFAAPWMRDANGVVSHAVRYEIERGGQSSRIAMRVDEAWLRAPERRFPVVVDPTVYRPAEHICEIRSGASASTSYCDSALQSLQVGRDSSGIVHRNLFDIEDLSAVVPDYAQVLSSYLAVYMIGQTPVETSAIDLHHLARDFAPGATWNSTNGRTLWSAAGGDYDSVREARASTPGTPPDDQLAFDMTEIAQRIVGHVESSQNVLLKAADESRTHVDTYWWPEVMVRWAPRTGLSPRYRFDHRDLSDGSTLDINLANGNIVLLANDIDLESDDGRFTVGRYFNNKNLGESSGTFGRGSRGDFGSISLERNAQDGSYIFFGPGADDGVFHKGIDGTFTPPPGLDATLTEQLDGTVTIDFNDSTETWTFDEDGRLVQTRQDYGYTIDGTYGSDGLATLRDSLGHAATFAYDGSGDMRTTTDEQSAVHRYDYDSSHRLITYTSPTSAQTRYAYDSSNRLQRITLPDRTALRISYHGSSTSPQYLTPIDASGVDQPATVYDGDFDYTTVDPPSPTARNVYFYDPYTLVTDLIQTGSAAAISTTGVIPDLDGRYTRGNTPLTVDVSAAQVPDGIQLTELEVDRVEVASEGPSPCNQWTCPTRARETLTYDPRSDPEGTHEYQVNTVDGDDDRTGTPVWRITIDRTAPPTSAVNFDATYDPDSRETDIDWEGGASPNLQDGSPGAPITSYLVRYQRDGGTWSAEQATSSPWTTLSGSHPGEDIVIEVKAVDAAGNVGAASSATLAAEESTLTIDDAGPLPADPQDAVLYPEPSALSSAAPEGLTAPLDAEANRLADTGYRETLCDAGSPCGAYDASEATAYALKWFDVNNYAEHNYNFDYFGGNGGDCTNFVSQALKAGGMRFMRARGRNSPDGNGRTKYYLKGEGSWWVRFIDTPQYGTTLTLRTYDWTTSFIRASESYRHLIDYGLARRLTRGERPRRGDIVYYNLHGLDFSDFDHSQLVTRVSAHGIYTAQHSPGRVRTMAEILRSNDTTGHRLGRDWTYVYVRPLHTAANITTG
jgi:YD repeat-containing protein